MTDFEALEILHRDLLACSEGRAQVPESLGVQDIVAAFERGLAKIWTKTPRNNAQREQLMKGTITVNDDEYKVNPEFQIAVVAVSDELEINEVEAARCVFDAQDARLLLDRPLIECGLIRFHQERKLILDSLRLALELDVRRDWDDMDVPDYITPFLEVSVIQLGQPTGNCPTRGIVQKCMDALHDVRPWLQKIMDRLIKVEMLRQAGVDPESDQVQTFGLLRLILLEQHELLGFILTRLVEKRQAEVSDLKFFWQTLRQLDKYDELLIHLMPAIGAYATVFASIEASHDFATTRMLHDILLPAADHHSWALPSLQFAVRVWWLAEYSGRILDGHPDGTMLSGAANEDEERQRQRQLTESLKNGALDFLLSVVSDVKRPVGEDGSSTGLQDWLQRKCPRLPANATSFSSFFQMCLVSQLEVFIDALITNLPDVLRNLRMEEDEQRQLSQTHEQDLDLERFLIIVARTYEGRPDAAMNFWSDPSSNLAGFMHWASRRASTPLVAAFCEMLLALSENEDCATAAHHFLLDEGSHSSGKMRRSQSLTWNQIFKELLYFASKMREKPAATQTVTWRPSKQPVEQVETEPESAMMLESYLLLIAKLALASETARQYLLRVPEHNIVDIVLQLASGLIPPRLRACALMTFKALMTRKTREERDLLWTALETWMTPSQPRNTAVGGAPVSHKGSASIMTRIFEEMSTGFEEPYAYVQLLTELVSPCQDDSELNDALPFPDTLGCTSRMIGMEPYVDYVMGLIFAHNRNDQLHVRRLERIRLACLEFVLVCLDSFNEDLIYLANKTSVAIDGAIAVPDLATYVRLHPFGRVIEWLFNDNVMVNLFATTHQEVIEISNAPADSPLTLSVVRGIEVIIRVLELQSTYFEIVRPIFKSMRTKERVPVANPAYISFEEAVSSNIRLVVDLGMYSGSHHQHLSLVSLKLLQTICTSHKISSDWNSSTISSFAVNKAVVALEANGDYKAISKSWVIELRQLLDPRCETEVDGYVIKMHILGFLHASLEKHPNRPSIAHLLLGLKCRANELVVEPKSAFKLQTSLFHILVQILIKPPSHDQQHIPLQLTALRSKALHILQILWSSPLTAPIVIEELRATNLLFHLLMHEVVIQPDLLWEDELVSSPEFPFSHGALAIMSFLSLRSRTLEYMAMEICSLFQTRLPTIKRRVFEALGGQVTTEEGLSIGVPSVFDLYDFLIPAEAWIQQSPALEIYLDIKLDECLRKGERGTLIYDLDLVRQVLLLKQNEHRDMSAVSVQHEPLSVENEQAMILDSLTALNRQGEIMALSLEVLRAWSKLMVVMIESSEFTGTAQISFSLQTLQTILPTLEMVSADRPDEALVLAKLALVVLSKLNPKAPMSDEQDRPAVGNLMSDKLGQLFSICVFAIGKWAGDHKLRTIYYNICLHYLAGLTRSGTVASARQATVNTIRACGERLLGVACDDAFGGDLGCQTAALLCIRSLINISVGEGDSYVIESLDQLNFIAILVDSLRELFQEWEDVIAFGKFGQQNYLEAKLALVLQLCQTREGAKHVIQANLFSVLQQSGLFEIDPELRADNAKSKTLELHYSLLATVARIIGAALVSRGAHNIVQGRRFLMDHRTLVTHTMKRTAGLVPSHAHAALEARIEDLAEAFVMIIIATDFVQYEAENALEGQRQHAKFDFL